jgi:hypothetical protein
MALDIAHDALAKAQQCIETCAAADEDGALAAKNWAGAALAAAQTHKTLERRP